MLLAIAAFGNRIFDPLSRVRDNCISLLRGVMSERGVGKNHWQPRLRFRRISDSLAGHHRPSARELAAFLLAAVLLAFAT
ncbi:hypothetical protein ACNKHL_09900 [Shigella flexneri]